MAEADGDDTNVKLKDEKSSDVGTNERPQDDDVDGEDTEKEEKIIHQIEYYFGDFNLGRDRFLQGLIKANDGWVPLDVILQFNRVRSLTTDIKYIAKALLKSTNKLLEVNEDKTKIRRSPDKPIPEHNEERENDFRARSVYAKGFPGNITLDELMNFFKQHGNVENINMRRRNGKIFKGSVFVAFTSKEDAEKFVKAESIQLTGNELLREMRQDYHKRKHDMWQKNKEERKKEKLAKANQATTVKAAKVEDDKKPEPIKGCVLHVTNIGMETVREDFKSLFNKYAKTAWIDFKKGDEEAWIRFEESKAQEALEKALQHSDGKLVIKGAELTVSVLEGEEEDQYLQKMVQARENVRLKSRRGRGRGGQFYKRKYDKAATGKESRSSTETPEKKVKLDKASAED